LQFENPFFEEIQEIQGRSIEMQIDSWIHHEVFSFQWWLLLIVFIAPWFIWWKFVDRKRLKEILLFGLLVMTVVTIVDEIGCQLNLWEYAFDLEPLFPRLIPVNLSALPVIYMLLYQYFSEWKSFTTATALAAAVLSFIGENLLELTGIYLLFKWKNIYSLPVYVVIGILLRGLLKTLLKTEDEAREFR